MASAWRESYLLLRRHASTSWHALCMDSLPESRLAFKPAKLTYPWAVMPEAAQSMLAPKAVNLACPSSQIGRYVH